jgi:tetratricopeptide (TPR) repeat protein
VADRITESVTELVTVPRGVVRLMVPRKTGNEAYEAYLKARHYSNQRTGESLLKAVHYFSRAVNLDPNLGIAYAGLAEAYLLMAIYEVLPPRETMPLAKIAALQALQINGNLAEAQAILAEIAAAYEWQWEEANERYKTAIKLNPQDRTVHHYYAFYLAAMGQLKEALSEIEIARSLDPHSILILGVTGDLLRCCAHYEEAVQLYLEILKLNPRHGLARLGLGLAYEQMGKVKKAVSELEIAAQVSCVDPYVLSALGHAQATAGNRGAALRTLKQLQALSTKRYVSAYDIAMAYLGIRDEAQTLEFMGRAFQERSCWLMLLPVDERAAPLNSNPQFKWILSRIGLPGQAPKLTPRREKSRSYEVVSP